ncbi:MAG: chorismate synthase [Candidatus Melainabacteria bacterium RIFCSPLOWO2_02_FULL_35_15]|nr:MAG: chorismate synthase [Candidatus Melainabacteria bacterium RIFCSPLOWO2_12_FULL_35_11]OGI14054.1 MAG: chorismate synthase [Candidatus Melainabacteria bacterium RIFCSPLOWO2_02_FULL_35_15]
MPIRFLTAGESHGPELNIILDGVPAGLELLPEDVNIDLFRRQGNYGRGGRMKIEKDQTLFTGGVRLGKTIGGPVSVKLFNNDFKNWDIAMSPVPQDLSNPEIKREIESKYISCVRPGHADLPGAVKYGHEDVRDVLERSSARETTSRVVVGAICKKLLKQFNIKVLSYVLRIGSAYVNIKTLGNDYEALFSKAEVSSLRCPDPDVSEQMKKAIDTARTQGDTLGGLIQVVATGVPVGLGSYSQWDKRLNGRIAGALASVHTVKSIEIGLGKLVSELYGSQVHDQIYTDENWKGDRLRYKRKTNNSGGIEGGMSNGQPIVCTVAAKPIPTLIKPLDSVDIKSKSNTRAHFERSDICVVPAAGVVLESMLAYVLADALLEKFGTDNVNDISDNYKNYLRKCYGR